MKHQEIFVLWADGVEYSPLLGVTEKACPGRGPRMAAVYWQCTKAATTQATTKSTAIYTPALWSSWTTQASYYKITTDTTPYKVIANLCQPRCKKIITHNVQVIDSSLLQFMCSTCLAISIDPTHFSEEYMDWSAHFFRDVPSQKY